MIRGLIRAAHPGPAVAVTIVTIVLGIGLDFDGMRLVVLGLAMVLGQISIGWSNDWIDAERDIAVDRADKPIAAGVVGAPLVRAAALAALALAVPFSFALGPLAGAVNLLGIVSGWSYNLGLKRTAFSGVPYIVTFGTLPLFVALSSPVPALAAWWALAAGGFLGLGAHFANVLPDLDDDARTGVRGLPHRLGRVPSGLAAFGSLVVASGFAAAGPIASGGGFTITTGVALGIILVIAVAGSFIAVRRQPTRLLFQLIMLSALVDVALLAATRDALRA